jgi:hypothetical protein
MNNRFYWFCLIIIFNFPFSAITIASQKNDQVECNKYTKKELLLVRDHLPSAYSDPSEKQVASNLIVELGEIIEVIDVYKQFDNRTCEKKLSLALDSIKLESERYIEFLATKFHPDSEQASTDIEYKNVLSNLNSSEVAKHWALHIESLSKAFFKLQRTKV